MKTFSRLATTALAVASIAGSSAAWAVSDTGTATATIIAPITVTAGNDLQFGKITQPTGGSASAVVGTDGSINVTGGGSVAFGGANQAGTFTVTANTGETVSISVTNVSQTVGTADVSLGSFVGDYGSSTGLDLTGGATGVSTVASDTMEIGATLTINDGAVAEAKEFTYVLNVSYE